MRLGTESVGRWGLAILTVAGALGVVLAIHGWSARSTGLPRASLGGGRPGAGAKSTPPPQQGPAAPGRSSAAKHRPLLSKQPYVNFAYQVWPGNPSASAKTALTGLSVSVRQQGSVLVVRAGVNGQGAPTPRRYPGGAHVYVVEAALGDDSGNQDYNLGDDALIVTDAKGGIIQ